MTTDPPAPPDPPDPPDSPDPAPPARLDDAALAAALAELDGWTRDGDRIRRELRFPDFVTAFGFMAAAALVAERMNHHPAWSNVYGTVRVELTTHDAGGLTHRDLELARAMDAIARRLR